ncbi:MAG: hypothetical protein KDE26_23505 [Bacteroidetes bacterium]|nr:hypothetical protein [Bacteroidota bacterium]
MKPFIGLFLIITLAHNQSLLSQTTSQISSLFENEIIGKALAKEHIHQEKKIILNIISGEKDSRWMKNNEDLLKNLPINYSIHLIDTIDNISRDSIISYNKEMYEYFKATMGREWWKEVEKQVEKKSFSQRCHLNKPESHFSLDKSMIEFDSVRNEMVDHSNCILEFYYSPLLYAFGENAEIDLTYYVIHGGQGPNYLSKIIRKIKRIEVISNFMIEIGIPQRRISRRSESLMGCGWYDELVIISEYFIDVGIPTLFIFPL